MRTPLFLSLLISATAGVWAADAQRGSAVLEGQGCLECHTVNAQGVGHEPNATAPDLGGIPSSPFTPAAFVSALWSHTPAMWTQVNAQAETRPALREADWADLFAYLYDVQVFQHPAETRRGQEVFRSQCGACHSPDNSGTTRGAPVAAWKDANDPVTLIYQMWNHASSMSTEFDARKQNWPKLEGRDFMDLAAYVQYVQHLAPEHRLSLPDATGGKAAFQHNCGQCHRGPLALETRLANKNLPDVGAGVWNHIPLMGPFPKLMETDMRRILAYVWDLQYKGPSGNVASGELAFAAKGCAVCHTETVTARSGKTLTPFSMAAVAWGPSRAMHQQMLNEGAKWPTLSPENVSDLVAYMNYFSRK